MERIDCNTIFGAWPSLKTDISLETLLERMERAEISKTFTCSTTGIFYTSKRGNEETLKACEQHENLLPVATITASG